MTSIGASLLITNGHTTPANDLFARYAERMLIENELDAYISGFSLNARSSSVPLNVDLDTTLTVAAGNLYRLFARNLPRYQHATPDTLWRHFLDDTGTLHITPTLSPPTSPCAATTPSSSTPASPTCSYPSPGGTASPCASTSHPADLPRGSTSSATTRTSTAPTDHTPPGTSIKLLHRESRLTLPASGCAACGRDVVRILSNRPLWSGTRVGAAQGIGVSALRHKPFGYQRLTTTLTL